MAAANTTSAIGIGGTHDYSSFAAWAASFPGNLTSIVAMTSTIVGSTLTVASISSGAIFIGMTLTGGGISAGTTVIADAGGGGSTGNYTLSNSTNTGNTPTGGHSPFVGQSYFNGSGDGEFVSATTLLTLSGHTTSSTDNITLTTGTGQSFRDNASVQTNAANYNASNGVGIRCSGAYNTAISAPDLNVVYSGLQIKAGVSATCIAGSGSTNIATIINCILTSGTGVVSALDLKATNTLFLLTGSGRSAVVSVSSASAFYFCTIAASSNVVTKPTNGVSSSYGTCTLENCAVFGATNVRSGSSTYTITTCMTDQASPPTGFTTVTYANQFVNTTIASGDFREKAGADLQGAGTADSTNGAFDIAGTARPQGSKWDIGCWELITSSSPVFWSYDLEPILEPIKKQAQIIAQAEYYISNFQQAVTPTQTGWNFNFSPTQTKYKLPSPPISEIFQPPSGIVIQTGWDFNFLSPQRRYKNSLRVDETIQFASPLTPSIVGWNDAFLKPQYKNSHIIPLDETFNILLTPTPTQFGFDWWLNIVPRNRPRPQPFNSELWVSSYLQAKTPTQTGWNELAVFPLRNRNLLVFPLSIHEVLQESAGTSSSALRIFWEAIRRTRAYIYNFLYHDSDLTY